MSMQLVCALNFCTSVKGIPASLVLHSAVSSEPAAVCACVCVCVCVCEQVCVNSVACVPFSTMIMLYNGRLHTINSWAFKTQVAYNPGLSRYRCSLVLNLGYI
uniref:Uncharacterized protein n=1 Tax=Dunaliella tertiolecta TaxID=3047 RepID=A0A7S3VIV5_DUNTE